MAHPHPFRFGVQASTAPDGDAWRALARRIEDLGFSSLLLPDHFGGQLAPVPAMTSAAEATTELRVGALVLDNDFKHPVVLAKEIATLDVLSGGRVELGIGAGWMQTDYDESGLPYDPPAVRVDRLEESVAVLKGLFGEEPCTVAGTHYAVAGLDGQPKPVQRPHPPFLIGGGGKRVLSFAAREADIVGISPNLRAGRIDGSVTSDATPDRIDEKYAWIREAAGDRFDRLELNSLLFAVVETDDTAGTAEMMAGMFGLDPAVALDVPLALVGSIDEMCERLEARRERWGTSYIVCQADAVDTMAKIVARLAGR